MGYSIEVRREAYALLGQGHVPRVVAERLGVSRMTVSNWRAEVGGVLPEPTQASERYLSREERYEIARLHEAGHGVREIGRRISRSPSTISRELNRVLRPARGPGSAGRPRGPGPRAGRYQPEACHRAAIEARARPRASKLARHPELWAWVQARLDERFSPEQIAGRLAVEFPDDARATRTRGVEDGVMSISHETIYRAIYLRPRGELRGELRRELRRELRAHLRTGRSQRHPHSTRQARQARSDRGQIPGIVSIAERPEEVEGRLVPGHYEGDLVVGPQGATAAVATLVERTSGHLTAFLIPTKSTQATITGLTEALTRTGWPMKTLTWDRGKEMTAHHAFTIDTGIAVYFADPYAPWQRGSNESANGLLREYFPKGTDFATITDHDLQAAVDQLNNRPRKRHQFLTPNEVLTAILIDDIDQPSVATTPRI